MTMVMSGLVAGAEMTTLRAPALRWRAASSRLVNSPVHSATMSTPNAFQSILSGSLTERIATDRPATLMVSPHPATSAARVPWTVSYLSRCAMVSAFMRSLMATTWMLGFFSAAR
jgi:hypothetical protein